MSSINQFPWQDDILRALHAGETASIDRMLTPAGKAAADSLP
jgi:hypothetical protein